MGRYASRCGEFDGDDSIRRILHHELAHAFFRARSGGSNPRWLNEGLAEYVEGVRTRDAADRVGPGLRDGQSLESCLTRERYDCRVFYPAAASLVDYIVQMRGMGGIRDLLAELGEGRGVDDALRRTVGRDERALIQEWERFARRRM